MRPPSVRKTWIDPCEEAQASEAPPSIDASEVTPPPILFRSPPNKRRRSIDLAYGLAMEHGTWTFPSANDVNCDCGSTWSRVSDAPGVGVARPVGHVASLELGTVPDLDGAVERGAGEEGRGPTQADQPRHGAAVLVQVRHQRALHQKSIDVPTIFCSIVFRLSSRSLGWNK